MDLSILTHATLDTPALVLDEDHLHANLAALATLRQRSGCRVLYSVKSLPFAPVLALARPYVDGFSVSSWFETQLAAEILAGGGSLHLATPGIRADEVAALAACCSHVNLNSLAQHQRFAAQIAPHSSVGLRVNPKLALVEDDRYNPCRLHSKLGVAIETLAEWADWDALEGLHLHTNFGAGDYAPLLATLAKLEQHLGRRLPKLSWLNLGGGYLYAQIKKSDPFCQVTQRWQKHYGLEFYIEPGKSVLENAAHLVASVIDLFNSDGQTVAILDTSVNHLPEVFEYQIQPPLFPHTETGAYTAILAGGTCLAGDLFGSYRFDRPLQLGDKVVFGNVGAYSLVKASRFNGHNLPDIYRHQSGMLEKIKHYSYADYREQWHR